MTVRGTCYPEESVLHRKVKHLSFDALARVGFGCFLVGKGWIPEPAVRETTQIGVLAVPLGQETTS
jgi:hypothetical protein